MNNEYRKIGYRLLSCSSKKSCPFVYREFTIKIGQDFSDILLMIYYIRRVSVWLHDFCIGVDNVSFCNMTIWTEGEREIVSERESE